MEGLRKKGRNLVLLEDRAPAHISRIAKDYLEVNFISKLDWLGYLPNVNAKEHAWLWIRRHITKDYSPLTCKQECRQQWETVWEKLP